MIEREIERPSPVPSDSVRVVKNGSVSLSQIPLGYATPFIPNLDLQVLFIFTQSSADKDALGTFRQRLQRIQQDIDEHLFELLRVAFYRG